MTILQQINTLFKEYVKTSLNSFYRLLITIFLSLFVIVSIATPFSLSKLISLILLFTLLIITSLLIYGNYQEEKIDKAFEEIEENTKEEKLLQIIEVETKIPEHEHTNKNFIA